MEAKYICGELPAAVGTCYGAIVFPSFMSHADVARALRVKATSAGMCYWNGEKWQCFGKSTTLGVGSLEGDVHQLNKLGKIE